MYWAVHNLISNYMENNKKVNQLSKCEFGTVFDASVVNQYLHMLACISFENCVALNIKFSVAVYNFDFVTVV